MDKIEIDRYAPERVQNVFNDSKEDSDSRSISIYATTKVYAEKIFWRADNTSKMNTMFIRSVNVTGVGQISAVIPLFINNLINGEPIYYHSASPDQSMVRTFMNVDDQVAIVYELFKNIEKNIKEESSGQPLTWDYYLKKRVFHIGNYNAMLRIEKIGEYLIDKYFHNGLLLWRPKGEGEEDVLGLNYDKIRNLLNQSLFKYKTIEDTIDMMYHYFLTPPPITIPKDKVFSFKNLCTPAALKEIKNKTTSKKICVVTGACGFIAPHLIEHLANDEENFVIGIGRTLGKPYPKHPYPITLSSTLNRENCIFVNLNLRNFEELKELFGIFSPDRVFHLAARAHVMDCQKNPEEAFKDNIEVCRNITRPELYGDKTPLLLLYSTDHLFSLPYNEFEDRMKNQ